MPTLRHASWAVEAVAAYLEASFAAHLTVINTEEEGTAVAAPSIYRRAIHPFAHEPVALEVESVGGRPEDELNDYYFHDVDVHVVLRGKDANVEQTQKDLRRYLSAIIRAIGRRNGDPTLGSRVVEAEIGDYSIAGASEEGRLQAVLTQRLTVKVHEA